MDANFFYHCIYDIFIQRQPCVCMGAFVNFFFKKLLRNYWLDFYQISQECFLVSLHRYRKNQACGAIQAD